MASLPSSRRRPAVLALAACVLGVLAAHALHLPALLLAGLAGALLAVAACRRGAARPVALLLALATAAALRHEARTELLPADHIARTGEVEAEVTAEGRVSPGSGVARDGRWQCVLTLERICAEGVCRPASGAVLVEATPGLLAADAGDHLAISGRLRRPQPARNPAAFDRRAYLARQGIHGTMPVHRQEQVRRWDPAPGPVLYERVIHPAQTAASRAIRANLQGESAALLQGMLLGDKQAIPDTIETLFRATGLAHALVVSGLHVGVLAGFVYLVLASCGCPERVAACVSLALLAAYALITGLQPPVVRAVTMAAAAGGARLLGRPADVYNGLGLAGLLLLCLWPEALFGLSFQLSFGATLAIVCLYRPLETMLGGLAAVGRASRLRRWVVGPVCVSLAAQLGTSPLLAYHFHEVAPLAPLANLVVVPLLAAALSLGLATVGAGAACAAAALPFAACNSLVLAAMLAVVRLGASLPGATLAVPRPGPVFMVWSVVELVLVARLPAGPGARRAALLGLLVGANLGVWGCVVRRGKPALEVVVLDVGQGDAAFVRFPNGRTLLVDGGDRTPTCDYGQSVVVPFLRSRGIRRLDVVVGTHEHTDHIGGLPAVLRAVRVGWYLDNGQAGSSPPAHELRELLERHRVRYRAVTAGDSLAGFGDGGVLVLHPRSAAGMDGGAAPPNPNNSSVVLRVTWGRAILLFTGDVEQEAELQLLQWGERLRAHVLKVPHHGAATSSSQAFVEAVAPRVAPISVGAGNRFGHPAARVLRVLVRSGALPVRTDQAGAVLLSLSARTIAARSMLPVPSLPGRWTIP